MEEKLISVIVPIYNVSRYLDRCMESLLNQTYRHIEIIMVDDGSPDDCGLKCEQYAREDARVRVIHKENAGLGMARNSGLEIAKGEYVAFIDSDDYVDQKMIERLYRRMQKCNADTCFCRYYDTSADGKDVLARETYQKEIYRGEEVKEVLLGMVGAKAENPGDVEIGMSVWKGLYSLRIIRENGIYFPSEREYISEDIVFHMRYLPKAGSVAVERTPGYHYCYNGTSLTKSYKADRFEMEKVLLEMEMQELRLIFSEEEYVQRLYKAFLGRVRRCIAQEVNVNSDRNMVRTNIRRICHDPLVQKVIDGYDEKNLQLTKRLVNLLIKYNVIIGIIPVFKLKN